MTYIAYLDSPLPENRLKEEQFTSHLEALKIAKEKGWEHLIVEDEDTGERFTYKPINMKNYS